jgi:hypothetical protein
MANTVKQIEEERKALDSSRKLLEELLSGAREEANFKAASEMQSCSTHITFGNPEKGFQIELTMLLSVRFTSKTDHKCRGTIIWQPFWELSPD